MGASLSYSLVTSVLLAVLYLMYKWLFAGEKQARYNRVMLWAIYIVAFAAVPAADAVSALTATAPTQHGGIEIGVITATIADSAESSSPGLTWLAVVYLAGAAAALLLTAITAVRLTRLICRGRHIRCNGYTVVLTDTPTVSPFSWGRYMVMGEADYCGGHSLIALHERAHIERHHWLDLLAGQLVAIFQWYNPAAWLMREELKALHEYQADDAVLRSGADARAYQMLLIKKAVGARFPSLANSLNHSKLKKRITMMYKQKSSTRRRLLRAAALVPALAASVALFQVPQVARAIGAVSEITLSADAVKADDMPLKAMPAPDRKVTIISENNETAGMAVSASQTTKVAVVADNKADKADEPVSVSAVMPEFPGGMQALMNYLSQNLRFPKEADCTTGRVVVKFVVTKTGKVSDVSILKSVGPEVDAEALRVVSSLPDFIPGKNEEGKPVSVYYALPINFTTTGGDDTSDAATPAADVKVTYYVNGKQVTKEEMLSIASDAIASINIENGADSSKTVNLTLK